MTPHEQTVTGHSAPPQRAAESLLSRADAERLGAGAGAPRPAPAKRNRHTSSTLVGAAVIPDRDPWRRARRRLLGLDPDDDLR